MTDLQNRYTHLDHSPYGSKGLMRFLATPSIYTGVPIAVAFAAAKTMLSPPGNRKAVFLTELGIGLVMPLLAARRLDAPRCEYIPETSVIDRSGQAPNDVDTHFHAAQHYLAKNRGYMAVAIIGSALGACGIFTHATAFQALVNARRAASAALNLITLQWTVQTNPPKIEEKEKSSLLDAFRPPTSTASMRALPRPAP
ncbi:MAG: hypothetical protein WDO70_01165 [Alphaproteobacteria bacterium]